MAPENFSLFWLVLLDYSSVYGSILSEHFLGSNAERTVHSQSQEGTQYIWGGGEISKLIGNLKSSPKLDQIKLVGFRKT